MKLAFLFFIILLSSCVYEIPIIPEQAKPKLVLNGGITTDTIISVFLGSSQFITDTTPSYINDATIELYQNNNFIEFLKLDSNGIYKSTIEPNTNDTYTLIAYCKNYDTIKASTRIPQKLKINYCNFQYNAGNFFDGTEASKLTINITDNSAVPNFYYINDGIKLENKYSLYLKSLDAVGLSGKRYSNHFIFSDELFSLSSANLVFLISKTDNRDTLSYSIKISTISQSYYLFLNSMFDYLSARESNFFDNNTEPAQVYSNVENGYGIFYGYNTATYNYTYILNHN